MSTLILDEAKRLYDLGYAIHWLHKKSKRPVESGWTSGPRHTWAHLEKTYRPGMNVGVRLGTASKVGEKFLGVIDCDVKSNEPAHAEEMRTKLSELLKGDNPPMVLSGRGNGSRHYYILTPKPITPVKLAQSTETVKVLMPSVKPSKRELQALSREELEDGYRLRAAWEIALMGEGQQVVLPPSIHPDSGKAYVWKRGFNVGAASINTVFEAEQAEVVDVEGKRGPKTLEGFEVVPVDLSWAPIPEKTKAQIETGEGVEDRSATLLPVAKVLFQAGLSQNEILSVLTDPDTFLGACAYQHAKTKSRERAANWVWRYTVKRVIEENDVSALFDSPIEDVLLNLTAEEMEAEQKIFDELWDWRLDLDRTAKDQYKATLRNVVLILENEIGEDLVRRDLFSMRDFYSADTIWGGRAGEAINDDDVRKIKLWLSNNYGFEPHSTIVSDALTLIAINNAFNPVKDWLESLPKWDGKERLDTWLKKYFRAKGDDEYLAQVFRKWLCAMVIRIYNPGAKFDWMPIFEGFQGYGKSSFGRILVGDKYFLDQLPDLMNKDAALALQGIWAVEMGELASFRKNEIEAVKAFVTRTVDKVRPPYGERWLEMPRHCVFFGTTNNETYLKDSTGNRRFKPVVVGRLNFEALERDRNQLFAEALWLYRTGFEHERTLEIVGDAKAYEAEIQAEKMVVDEATLMAGEIRKFIRKELQKTHQEKFDFGRFKLADLFTGSPGTFELEPPLKNWKFDSRNVQFAAKALKEIGSANFKSNGDRLYKITNLERFET